MRSKLVATFEANGHLLTRRQALEAGATTAEIDRWVRTGAWVNVRRGVYALREFWDGLDEWRASPCTPLARPARPCSVRTS